MSDHGSSKILLLIENKKKENIHLLQFCSNKFFLSTWKRIEEEEYFCSSYFQEEEEFLREPLLSGAE